MFQSNSFPVHGPINRKAVSNSDFNTDSSNYFIIHKPERYTEEWGGLTDPEILQSDITAANAFTIRLGLKYMLFMDIDDDINIAKVILGIRDEYKVYRICIAFGLNRGYLFIGDVDGTVKMNKDWLTDGVEMVLNVSPVRCGGSLAVLSVVDRCGLLLARLKSNKFRFADWKGKVSPGAHFRYLYIEQNN